MKEVKTKVITGKVRLSFCNIWEPTAFDPSQPSKYSTSMIIPKSDTKTLEKINKAIEAAKEQGLKIWGGKIPANCKEPLRDGDEERPDDENYANSYFLNASCKAKPGVLDRAKKPVTDESEVYSGCYAMVSLNFYPYATGSKGVAAGLNNILKIADGDSLGGRVKAEVDFGDVDLEEFDDELLG
jgi:hypothetical protein